MMVHGNISLTQPVVRAVRERHSMIVNAHESPAACRVNCEPHFLNWIQAVGSLSVRDENKLVRLAYSFLCPLG
jgi:hypothetical protein